MARLVECHPVIANTFCGYRDERLELYVDEEKVKSHSNDSGTSSVTCMGWIPQLASSRKLVFGCSNGSVAVLDWNTNTETAISGTGTKAGRSNPRSCSSVACKSTQLAAGFDLTKNDHGVMIFDIESGSGALTKLCYEESTTSLNWLPQDPLLIAVGTAAGWVRIYDTRVPVTSASTTSADFSLMAHPAPRPRKVRGIISDPYNPNLIATWSDGAGDAVKIWDLRKGSMAKSKLSPSFTVLPHGIDESSVVVDLVWSTTRQNVVAVVTSNQSNQISFYCTNKGSSSTSENPSTRSPIYSVTAPSPILAFSMKKGNNNLLLATEDCYFNRPIFESLPLDIAADGRILCGVAEQLCLATRDAEAESEVDSWLLSETTMSDRSSAGYSLDAGKNMQVLSDEVDSAGSGVSIPALLELSRVWCWVDRVESMRDDSMNLTNCGVLKMFQTHASRDEQTTLQPGLHPVLGVKVFTSSYRTSARTVCGWTDMWTPPQNSTSVISNNNLLMKVAPPKHDKDDDGESSSSSFSDASTIEEYSELEGIVEECEDLDSFERAAAFAVWHGNVGLAVEVLQRNLLTESKTTSVATGIVEDAIAADATPDADGEYLQLISLVAMCFAGYNVNAKTSAMWSSMCSHVLVQLEAAASKRQSASYLVAACRFLLGVAKGEPNAEGVVFDDRLFLEDRIAFACAFLSDDQVVTWLSDVEGRCKHSGSCEGLLVTGLSDDGLDILQQYIDVSSDIQTAALLVGRMVSKVPDHTSPPREWLWLFEYRTLLNRWQMFIERASLDVELGKLQRLQRSVDRNRDSKDGGLDSSAHGSAHGSTGTPGGRSAPFVSSSMRPRGGGGSGGGAGQVDRKTSLHRTIYTLPVHSDFPHVFLRCHYCSSSLPVDAMQQQNTAFLRKQRPIINFCPNCKKPLPRCYVCQLYVGLINPHAEVSRVLAQKRRVTGNLNSSSSSSSSAVPSSSAVVDKAEEDKSDHNILDFGRWLFFCQKCKHGGHSSCINDWFEEGGRNICGVNGCSCICGER